MTNPVIEIVNFRLASGVSAAAFLAEVPASDSFIKAQPGFVARRLSEGSDGRWLEHIEWRSMEEAKAASEAIMQEASLAGFMQSFDMESVEMRHQNLHVSTG